MSGLDDPNWSYAQTALTAAYSLTSNDYYIAWDATAGAFAVTLPAASAALAGREYRLVQKTSVANQVTVKTAGGTINGVAAGTGVAQTASKIGLASCVCDGANWWMQLI